jgi:phage baseplate assembly protein W
MANIKLDSLKKSVGPKYKSYFTYADLSLDLKLEQLQNEEAYSKLHTKDVRASYDLAAIENSIKNLFTSFPGDKLLNPEFGLNLNQFLFMPCSESTAQQIGTLIHNEIKRQEPRVRVEAIEVVANIPSAEYDITLTLAVPFINNVRTIELKALLNSTGVLFYN